MRQSLRSSTRKRSRNDSDQTLLDSTRKRPTCSQIASEETSTGTFRLLALPLELREEIYRQCAGPVPALDTAAIRNHGIEKIPLIAQLCRQVRQEALDVLYRKRELKFSLHCERNTQRGREWLRAAGSEEVMPGHITFSGKLEETREFFYLTVRCSTNSMQQFTVEERVGEAANRRTATISGFLKHALQSYLDSRASRKIHSEQAGKLQGAEVLYMLKMVEAECSTKRVPTWQKVRSDKSQ